MSEKRKVTMDDALAAGDSVILNVQAARIEELEKALQEIADPAGIAQSLEAGGSIHVLENLARRALYMQRIARAAIAKAKGEE